MRLGTDTLSVTSWMMGTGGTPVKGEGATEYLATDRHAFTVTSVSADGKACTIREDIATRADKNGMSDSQSYEYSFNEQGKDEQLVYRWGGWKRVKDEIAFTDELNDWIEKNPDLWHENYCYNGTRLLDENNRNWLLVPGATKMVKRYSKINIRFGIRQKYYDFSY